MNPDPSPNISSLRNSRELDSDQFPYMPDARLDITLSMLQKLSKPEISGPEGITILKLSEILTRRFGLPAAHELTSDVRQLLGAEKGRRKGADTAKVKGAETLKDIVAHMEKIGAKPTDRGLAQKIARAVGRSRSMVSRHLNRLKKQK
jgi:hypothetical protein